MGKSPCLVKHELCNVTYYDLLQKVLHEVGKNRKRENRAMNSMPNDIRLISSTTFFVKKIKNSRKEIVIQARLIIRIHSAR